MTDATDSTPRASRTSRFWSKNRRWIIITSAVAFWFLCGLSWPILVIVTDFCGPQKPGDAGKRIAAVIFENRGRVALCRSPALLAFFRNVLNHYGSEDGDPEDSSGMTRDLDVTIFFRSGVSFVARGRLGPFAPGRLGWYFTEASLNDGPRWYTSTSTVPLEVKSLLRFLRGGKRAAKPKLFREF